MFRWPWGAAYGSGNDVDSDGAALFVIGKGRGAGSARGDIAQGLETTSLIAASCCARGRHAALVVVVAAFGQGQWPFHRFDHFEQRDLDGRAGQAVAATDATQAFDQAGLGQWRAPC